MSVERVEVIPIELPFRDPYRTARGTLAARSMALVAIFDRSGVVGTGEAVPLSLRGGPSLDDVTAELDRCGRLLLGAETETPASGRTADIRRWIEEQLERARAERAGAQALCALDVALHDLAGRLSGMPIWRLLGASGAEAVSCNASIDAAEPERAGVAAGRLRGLGFGTFKVKVGVAGDPARVAAVRSGAGEDARIRVDANGAWDPDRAISTLRELEPLRIELAEQPCADLAGLAAVREAIAIPVVADESVASAEDAERAVAEGACDAATIKLAKVGGPLEAIRIAETIPSLLSSALDGPIGIAAAIHTAQALPRRGWSANLAHGLATLEMFAETYAPIDGLFGPSVEPQHRPGHGIEFDPDRVLEYASR